MKGLAGCACLLLISGLGLQAQDVREAKAPAVPLQDALRAYNDLYTLCVTEHKRADADVIEKILNGLKAHFKEYPAAFTKAGDFYLRVGNAPQAIREYEEGLAADSVHKVDYQKRLVEVYIRLGKMDDAREMNRQILGDHPRDPDVRSLDASFRLDKGEVDAALLILQAVTKDAPDNFIAHFNLGRAYFAKGDAEKAREQFEVVVKDHPDYKPARLALMQLALRTGDVEVALKLSQDYLKTDPNNSVAMLLEAAAYARKGQYDDSRMMLERLLSANPNQPDALLELGVLDLAQKRYGEAEEPFREAFAANPNNLRGLVGIAEIYFQQNEPEKAVRTIADEASKRPQRADIRKELGKAELRAKQYDRAIGDFQASLDGYKDSPLEQADIYNMIGIADSTLGKSQSAVENMQKAALLAPKNVTYLSNLAQYYDNDGKARDAVASYRDALKLDPDNAVALNNLAYLITRSGGDLDEALALAQHARQRAPKMNEVSDTIGWIYLQKNLTASAIEVFRELTEAVKNNPTFHYHYALALSRKGDNAGALQELNTALQCHPNQNEESEIRGLMRKLS